MGGPWYSHASWPLIGRRIPRAGTPTPPFEPGPPFRPGPLPPFCSSLGRGKGSGVPARDGVPARGFSNCGRFGRRNTTSRVPPTSRDPLPLLILSLRSLRCRGPPTTHHPHRRPSSSGGIFGGGGGWCANCRNLIEETKYAPTPSFALAMLIIDFMGVVRGYRGLKMSPFLGNVSETPTPTTCLKSTAVHPQFVWHYVRPPLYRRTFLASNLRGKGNPAIRLPFVLQYASICTAVRPPFVRQYFWKSIGGWGPEHFRFFGNY